MRIKLTKNHSLETRRRVKELPISAPIPILRVLALAVGWLRSLGWSGRFDWLSWFNWLDWFDWLYWLDWIEQLNSSAGCARGYRLELLVQSDF